MFTMPSTTFEAGSRMLSTYANFYTSPNTFFESYSMIDSFVGVRKTHEGTPATVDLGEAEEEAPVDAPLETVPVGFLDKVQDPLCSLS